MLGVNPITAYTLAALGARLLNMPAIERETGKAGSASTRSTYNTYLTPYLWPMNASLAYAGSILLACIVVVAIMDLLNLHVRA